MSQSRKIAWKIRVCLVLFGLLLGLGAAEIALRLIPSNKEGTEFEDLQDLRAAMKSPSRKKSETLTLLDVINENPNEKIIYELRPNLDVTFTDTKVHTNSFGLRGPETTKDKPPKTYRIALLGDSFAFGWGVLDSETFARVMENSLNTKFHGNPRIEVLNFGVPGYSTFQEAEVFKEKALDFSPNLALVFFIHNDFDYPFFVRDISKKDLGTGESALVRLTGRVLDPNKVQRQMEQQGIDPNSALRALDDICKKNNITLAFSINPRKDWRSYLQRLVVLKERESINILDIASDFDKIIEENNYNNDQLNLPNDPHPSVLRHKIYGELLADRIAPLVFH